MLGYDIGSSSIKAALLDPGTGKLVASAASPKTELEIHAPKPGWAEQDPETWWEHVKSATAELAQSGKVDLRDVAAIGIAYQMHGLVIVDKNLKVLRPSIIWCDSRAVEIGEKAFSDIGKNVCLGCMLNSPGNFTVSKLKWVKEYEPGVYKQIYKAMLPGDYVAMKLTGDVRTTASGLSEGILWDFQKQSLADNVLEYFGISTDVIADIVPTFAVQGAVTKEAADELGLKAGIPVSYRAGDQPNNALSLNVLNPGEVAATAGTSGVIYGVTTEANYDPQSRVNIFVHVTHKTDEPRYGVLMCINGTGILNRWLRHEILNVGKGITYEEMNEYASRAPIGADGLVFLTYGNGAERTLCNKDIGASMHGLNFNMHDRSHILRAAQEGIVFALKYGFGIMNEMGIEVKTIRAGYANMFLSLLFDEAFANTVGVAVELYNTDGAQGAARGAGIGAGIFHRYSDAFIGLEMIKVLEPEDVLMRAYEAAYEKWLAVLNLRL